jgi:hypothetical protein
MSVRTLAVDEASQLEPRPALPKRCLRGHRIRTPAGLPTANLVIRRNELTGGTFTGGCRACTRELRAGTAKRVLR